MRKYIRFVDRNLELYDEIVEKEINLLDRNTKTDGKEYAPLSEVLRVNMNNCVQINACAEADDVEGKKRRIEEDSVFSSRRSGKCVWTETRSM